MTIVVDPTLMSVALLRRDDPSQRRMRLLARLDRAICARERSPQDLIAFARAFAGASAGGGGEFARPRPGHG